mmetsp:Transcript_22399/g.48946  ORF Transcript_22399/g.48946 Transcript_22399/m.48946 type:complete len:204 (+) Transcript_22399:140-751(+)
MSFDAGELTLTLEFGQNLKEREWFGRQDAYCILTCGNQRQKSRTCWSGGKNPSWNQTFRFDIKYEKDVFIVCNYEDLTKDEVVGTGNLRLSRVLEEGTDRVHVPMVSPGGHTYGFISVDLKFARHDVAPEASAEVTRTHSAPPAPRYSLPPFGAPRDVATPICQLPAAHLLLGAVHMAPPAAVSFSSVMSPLSLQQHFSLQRV